MYDTRCGIPKVERPRNDVSDGKSWKCPQCKLETVSGRKFFFQVEDVPSEVAVDHLPLGKRIPSN